MDIGNINASTNTQTIDLAGDRIQDLKDGDIMKTGVPTTPHY